MRFSHDGFQQAARKQVRADGMDGVVCHRRRQCKWCLLSKASIHGRGQRRITGIMDLDSCHLNKVPSAVSPRILKEAVTRVWRGGLSATAHHIGCRKSMLTTQRRGVTTPTYNLSDRPLLVGWRSCPVKLHHHAPHLEEMDGAGTT